MNFIQALNSYFKNTFNFKGRASRSEYWYSLFNAIIILVMLIFFPRTTHNQTIPKIFRFLLFVPNVFLLALEDFMILVILACGILLFL